MQELFKEIHQVWLATLHAGFISKTSSRVTLYNFSDIFWRHFGWIENYFIRNEIHYNYDIPQVPLRVEKLSYLYNDIINRLKKIQTKLESIDDLRIKERINSDIIYIVEALKLLEDEDVTAFSMNRQYNNMELSDEARDALTLFLFEESYKEYELILVYNYSKANSNSAFLNRIYEILIGESVFHLRSFGEMMATMGILAVPRMVMEEIYKFEDLEQFLLGGIDEERKAKENCKALSNAVSQTNAHFASFFEFINNQENYHIALMQEALTYILSQKENI